MTGGIGIGFVKFSVPKTKLRLLAQCLMKRKLLNFLLLVNYLSRIISSLVTALQNPVLRPDQILQTHADGMPRYGHRSSSRFGLCNPTHGEHSHLTEEDVAVLWRGGGTMLLPPPPPTRWSRYGWSLGPIPSPAPCRAGLSSSQLRAQSYKGQPRVRY